MFNRMHLYITNPQADSYFSERERKSTVKSTSMFEINLTIKLIKYYDELLVTAGYIKTIASIQLLKIAGIKFIIMRHWPIQDPQESPESFCPPHYG